MSNAKIPGLRNLGVGLFAMITFVFLITPTPQPTAMESKRKAPEFTHTDADSWIGSNPLSWHDLKGKVVLLDIWTFDCWNCYRSFPWLNDLEKRYGGQGLQIIGIHAPEFSHEKERRHIEAKMTEFKLNHPVMIDNDFSYWKALGNHYWPTFYLVDKKGEIRFVHIGETRKGSDGANKLESTLKTLLHEPS